MRGRNNLRIFCVVLHRGTIIHTYTHFNIKIMAKTDKSVRALIDDLEVGASVNFPLERYEYVVSCRSRVQLVGRKRFKSTTDKEAGVVVITRTEDKPE